MCVQRGKEWAQCSSMHICYNLEQHSFILENKCSLSHAHMHIFLLLSAISLFKLLLASWNEESIKHNFVYLSICCPCFCKVGATSAKLGQNLTWYILTKDRLIIFWAINHFLSILGDIQFFSLNIRLR